jgi:hypothetical protein
LSEPKKPVRDAVAALLDLAAGDEQTPEEAEAELRANGVDVDGFLGRLRTRLKNQAEEGRLAWLTSARAKLPKGGPTSILETYKAMDRGSLVAEFKNRQTLAERAQAWHHKLDEITDDDLRTLLMDFDALDAAAKDKT